MIEDFEAFEKTIHFLHKDRDEYHAKLKGLVEFCNWLARDMPWKLRDAIEELDKVKTHPSMVRFILLYEEMMKRFK